MIWVMLAILAVVSIMVVYSATGTLAYSKYHGDTYTFLMRQSFFVISALMLAYIVHLVDLKVYYWLSKVLVWVSFPLLLITMAMGASLNEASRWLSIGGFTFQTSDFAKVALVMYVAYMLAIHQNDIKDIRIFGRIMAMVGAVCILILPNNFSTAAMLGMICIMLMFVGRVRIRHILLTGIAGIALFTMLFFTAKATGFQAHRLATWEKRAATYMPSVFGGDEAKKPSRDDTFQADQSKIAIATGGILGKGPGNSTQRNYLPHPYSDFIYAIIIEEYGLVGGFIILIFYLALLYRAGVLTKKSDKTFPAFLTMGLVLLLVVQAMINMGVAVGILPVTGQTLPFVSMGGSSLWMTGIVFGIIQSANRKLMNPTSSKEEAPIKEKTEVKEAVENE